MDSWFSFFLAPRCIISAIADPEGAKNLAGESPPPDSDPFNDVNEPFAHGLTLREESQVELLGETPNGLSASAILPAVGRSVYYILV